MEKSRHEKRKEARLEKNQKKHQSWVQHQKSQKLKRTSPDLKSTRRDESENSCTKNFREIEVVQPDGKPSRNQISKQSTLPKEVEVQLEQDQSTVQQQIKVKLGSDQSTVLKKIGVKTESFGKHDSAATKMVKGKKGLKRSLRTKFEEYLEMDKPSAALSAEEDLKLERRLAKKLKVKGGKLRGGDDDINMLIEGIPSLLDSLGEELTTSSKKRKKKKLLEQDQEGENVDDLTVRASDQGKCGGAGVAPEEVPVEAPSHKRHIKRKLSRQGQEGVAIDSAVNVSQPVEIHDAEVGVKEAPVPARAPALKGSVKYVAPHLRSRAGNEPEEHTQIRRRIRGILNRLSESNVEAVTGEMSTIFRSITRSVASQIFNEEILASCSSGPRGNEQYAAVFAAFVAGMACLVGMDFSAKLMASLAKSFEDEYHKEDNLSLRNITLLLSYLCIFGVCSSDLIYDFLITLSKRLMEIDVSTILTVLQCCGMKLRGDDPAAMKNFIVSVQTRVNELKAASGDGQEKINGKRMEFMLETICDIKNNKKRTKEDTAQHTRIKKWLQKLRVEEALIRGLKWSKLLDPEKKGLWWLSGDMAATEDTVEQVARTIDKEVLEAQKILQLAAAQRMNTDARKAIFCIIMSGEDYIDAFDKLLRLDLPGKQDREIMRVLVECCLQENVFNKYYTVLASKLCEHDKNHRFTLQYCLWDHFQELESMPLLRSMHLSKFVAEMITSFTLSLAVLKAVDLSDAKQLTPKRIMHFRILFEAIFEYPDKLIWNIFTRIAVNPYYETLRNGIEFFIKECVVNANKAITNKFKVAKKALNNAEGILM